MAIRRLSRGEKGSKESAWKPPQEEAGSDQTGADSDQAGDAGSGSAQRPEWQPSQLIASLHQAKQELAKEMEANLKQLKAVLKETQRIAKDMEAVLQESKNGLGAGGSASGGSASGGSVAGGGAGKQNGDWNPPGYLAEPDGQEQSKKQPSWGQQSEAESPAEDLWSDPSGTSPSWIPPESEKDLWQPRGID